MLNEKNVSQHPLIITQGDDVATRNIIEPNLVEVRHASACPRCALLPFFLLALTEISSTVLLCVLLTCPPEFLHAGSSQLPACLPAIHITLQHCLLNKSFAHYFLSPLCAFGS